MDTSPTSSFVQFLGATVVSGVCLVCSSVLGFFAGAWCGRHQRALIAPCAITVPASSCLLSRECDVLGRSGRWRLVSWHALIDAALEGGHQAPARHCAQCRFWPLSLIGRTLQGCLVSPSRGLWLAGRSKCVCVCVASGLDFEAYRARLSLHSAPLMAIVAKRPDGDAPDQGAALPVHVPPVNLASGAAQLSILPHEGRVSLGRCASDPPQMQLVHKDTLEVRILAAGPDWQLVFDEDGYGAVTDMDGAADPIVLEQFLDRTLCEADDGTLAIIERKGGRTRVWSLSAKLAGFTRIRVRVLVGPTQSKEEMLAVLLAWPRQQSRVMWNSLRFYTLLCLKSYSSQPSKWVWSSSKVDVVSLPILGAHARSTIKAHLLGFWNSLHAMLRLVCCRGALVWSSGRACWFLITQTCSGGVCASRGPTTHKAWIEYLDCLGFEGRYHVMGSQQASRCNMDEAQAPVLPHPVLSTLAVLALCVRWAAHVPQAGGLRDPRGQNAALAFLEGLLQGVSAIRSFCLQVRFVESWVCPYPHEEATAPDMTLRVSAEGYVNVAEWVAMVDQGHPLAIEWWTKFVAPEIATVGLSLVRLLTRCSMEARHRSLFSQLLYQLAFRCEVCVAGSLRSPPPRTQGLRAQAVDIMDVINHNSRLNFELLQYNYASMKATENADYVSIANDKGNVGGLQLSCGVIALPNNKAFVACPQEPCVFPWAPTAENRIAPGCTPITQGLGNSGTSADGFVVLCLRVPPRTSLLEAQSPRAAEGPGLIPRCMCGGSNCVRGTTSGDRGRNRLQQTKVFFGGYVFVECFVFPYPPRALRKPYPPRFP